MDFLYLLKFDTRNFNIIKLWKVFVLNTFVQLNVRQLDGSKVCTVKYHMLGI